MGGVVVMSVLYLATALAGTAVAVRDDLAAVACRLCTPRSSWPTLALLPVIVGLALRERVRRARGEGSVSAARYTGDGP